MAASSVTMLADSSSSRCVGVRLGAALRAQLCHNCCPAPMGEGRSVLGRFLGFGVNARQRAASFDFYRSLGFEPVPVADGEPAPYAALPDGTIAIGLHDRPDEAGDGVEPSIAASFVRPNLTSCVRTYRRLGIELEIERLASDEFNEVGFTDPSGLPIRVLEARTFSPAPADARHAGACGTFLEL